MVLLKPKIRLAWKYVHRKMLPEEFGSWTAIYLQLCKFFISLDGEGIAHTQFLHSQSSQSSPASYPIIARPAFLGQLHLRFILLQPFSQNQILVPHPLLCKVAYEALSQSTENTHHIQHWVKRCFPDLLKWALCVQRSGTDHPLQCSSSRQVTARDSFTVYNIKLYVSGS